MENTLRNLVLFVWSVLFGFFSLTAYLDDTMASSTKIFIVVGLLVILAAYLAFELYTRQTNAPSPLDKIKPIPPIPADDRVLRRLHASAQEGGSTEPSTRLKPRPTTITSAKN